MGIAIVVPARKILEVIQQPAITDREKNAETELRKRIEEQNLPKTDSGDGAVDTKGR